MGGGGIEIPHIRVRYLLHACGGGGVGRGNDMRDRVESSSQL